MELKAKNPLVTLYGSNYINNEWTIPCMRSWKKILNLSPTEVFILPDNNLTEEESAFFSEMNFNLMDVHQIQVESFLSAYPALDTIRKKDVTWRKLLDAAILFGNAEKITIIDTDVYVKDQVILPLEDCDLAYMREDIPAYRGKWSMVWKEKMVPALNAGIIIVDPRIIDFDYLEHLVIKYFLNCKNYWWTEQSAWACLAGKSTRRLLFSGAQVRVTSGTKKRSPDEVSKNEYKYFGKKGMLETYQEFEPLLKGGSIFHFAGPGKYMFQESLNYLNTCVGNSAVNIVGETEKTLSLRDKMLISLRLYLKEL